MAHFLVFRDFKSPVLFQQGLALSHTQLTELTADLDESTVAAGTIGSNLPYFFIVACSYFFSFISEEALSERVVDVSPNYLIPVTSLFRVKFHHRSSHFCLDHFPNVVLDDMV